jgi:hypothetical protein
MWQDPIVTETRALREAYAAQFHHDPVAIFDDILKRQAESGKKLVRFPPRKPRIEPTQPSTASASD